MRSLKVGDNATVATQIAEIDHSGRIGIRIVGSEEIVWAEPENVRPGEPDTVCLRFSATEAARLSEGMADLLCWVGGFRAACPDALDRHPMGVEETRDIRIALKHAIARARGDFPPEVEMPF